MHSLMKTILSILFTLFLFVPLSAQISSDDLVIIGNVGNEIDGQPIPNHSISTFVSGIPVATAVSDSNGFFTMVVFGGSMIGPNTEYSVITTSCDGSITYTELVINGQGTIDSAQVFFSISCPGIQPCQAYMDVLTDNQTITVDGITSVNAVSYNWTFTAFSPDESTIIDVSSASGPQTVYNLPPTAGKVNICLITTSQEGCVSSICEQLYFCSANFNMIPIGFNDYSLSPLANQDLNKNYQWTIYENGFPTQIQGFGGINLNTAPNSEYLVCFEVDGPGGCYAQTCDTLSTIDNSSCPAEFVHTYSNGLIEAYPTFIAQIGLGYTWTISEPGIPDVSLTGAPFSYSPIGNNGATLCLTVSNPFTGCSNTTCQWIETLPSNGDCSAIITTTTLGNDSYSFTLTPSGPVQSYNWFINTYDNFGNPTSAPYNSSDSTAVLSAGDPYTFALVCVEVLFADGCSWGACDTVISANAADSICFASFDMIDFNTPNELGLYQFVSQNGWAGHLVNHTWIFPDGTQAYDPYPVYFFDTPGTYEVCHITSSLQFDCSDTLCLSVTIDSVAAGGGPCDASFTPFVTENTVLLVPDSFPEINGNHAQWFINDLGPIDQFATNVYLQNGTYNVCLLVWNNSGCQAYSCDTVVVDGEEYAYCQAYFSNNNTGLTVNFENWSYVYPDQDSTLYYWSFGDGTTTQGVSPSHTYAQEGWYTVTLTMVSGNCTNEYSNAIYVSSENTSCSPVFSASVLTNNAPFIVQTYAAINPFEIGVQHIWTTSDGQISYDHSPLFYFNSPGTAEICHIIVNNNSNCSDTLCSTINLIGLDSLGCSAFFTAAPGDGTQPGLYTLSAFVQSPDYTYEWDVNGELLYGANQVVYIDPAAGAYVCLTVFGANGCFDDYCTTIVPSNDPNQLSIWGSVFAGANPADIGVANLYSADSTGMITLVATSTIVSGYYFFSGLNSGTYYIQASLNPESQFYSNYVPTYFGSQYYWELAEPVVLSLNEPVSAFGYPISLIFSGNSGGPGGIQGTIDDGPFRLMDPALNNGASSNPVHGAHVIVTNLLGVPQRWTASNEDGWFQLGNLAYGTYRILADVAGWPCVPVEFTISPDYPQVNMNIVMGEQVTFVVEPVKAEIGLAYPNPLRSNETLRIPVLSSNNQSITASLFNLSGQQMIETVIDGSTNTDLSISTTGLAAGVYFLRVSNAQTVLLNQKITIIP